MTAGARDAAGRPVWPWRSARPTAAPTCPTRRERKHRPKQEGNSFAQSVRAGEREQGREGGVGVGRGETAAGGEAAATGHCSLSAACCCLARAKLRAHNDCLLRQQSNVEPSRRRVRVNKQKERRREERSPAAHKKIRLCQPQDDSTLKSLSEHMRMRWNGSLSEVSDKSDDNDFDECRPFGRCQRLTVAPSCSFLSLSLQLSRPSLCLIRLNDSSSASPLRSHNRSGHGRSESARVRQRRTTGGGAASTHAANRTTTTHAQSSMCKLQLV